MFGVWCLVFGVCCLVFSVYCLLFTVFCSLFTVLYVFSVLVLSEKKLATNARMFFLLCCGRLFFK
ncbi:hypothetical protein FHG64_02530 [Antarcticibacterium flavum]|uniref:Uncharacterized protein n=1 Tax=Antarcticibacterium flavum TaxID=2058175 RepID=A0A5B7X109_9FLAO|nr:hypothetical protein FHG64_02530 [Antarcticibacterium flavum]